MLKHDNLVQKYMDLSVYSTDAVCAVFNAKNIFEAWSKGNIRYRVKAINLCLGCKRHGIGSFYLFRGELKKWAQTDDISVDYTSSGEIKLDAFTIQQYLKRNGSHVSVNEIARTVRDKKTVSKLYYKVIIE